MSLAIAVVQKDYIVTSSDLAVTFFLPDIEEYEKTGRWVESGEMIGTDAKSPKTFKISDTTILMATGNIAITATLEVELRDKGKTSSTIEELQEIAQNVMSGLRVGEVDNLDIILNDIAKTIPVYNEFEQSEQERIDDYWEAVNEKIDDARGISAYLVGFDSQGSAALHDIIGNRTLYAPKNDDEGYPVAIVGDTINEEHYKYYLQALDLPPSHREKEYFMEQMAKINYHVAETRGFVNVSSECLFQSITKNGKQYDYDFLTFDTKEL